MLTGGGYAQDVVPNVQESQKKPGATSMMPTVSNGEKPVDIDGTWMVLCPVLADQEVAWQGQTKCQLGDCSVFLKRTMNLGPTHITK